MVDLFNLAGRIVVVTGASSGIGLATAIQLSRLGARVVMISRSEPRLAAAVQQLSGTGHLTVPYDLAASDGVPDLLKTVAAQTGPISGLVHCAGTQLLRPLRVLTNQDVDGLLKLNVNAALMLAKAFRQKGVRANPGSIVFVSSVMGLVGTSGRATYSAAKSALHAMTKSLALELAAEQIRVNCVAPGFVRTPMLQEAETTLGGEQLKRVEAMHPLGFGSPDDVSNAIAFLLGDTGRWVTGTILVVDGGYTAH